MEVCADNRPAESSHRWKRRAARGFSLLELIAVVLILGVLAAMIIARLAFPTDTARINVCHDSKALLNRAIEQYMHEFGTWPTTIENLEAAGYFPEGVPNCPQDNTAYTIDATTHRIDGHDHDAGGPY